MNMKEYKLNIDPRILELLGPSLYTNIYYIIAELIANAYDADAHFPDLDADPEWQITADSEEQTYFDLEYYFYRYERVKK